jgi:hypothetical protein
LQVQNPPHRRSRIRKWHLPHEKGHGHPHATCDGRDNHPSVQADPFPSGRRIGRVSLCVMRHQEAVAERNAFLAPWHDVVCSGHFPWNLPGKSLVCQTPRSLAAAPRSSCRAHSSTNPNRIGVTQQAPRDGHQRERAATSHTIAPPVTGSEPGRGAMSRAPYRGLGRIVKWNPAG